MKFLFINSVCGIRSTGRICTDLAVMLEAKGHQVKIAYGRETVPETYQRFAHRIESPIGVRLHALLARLADASGFGSRAATRRFIRWIEAYDPDVIHLHNIHGYYLHLPLFFQYLRRSGKRILWSFYDCWSFTGHCAHFDYIRCDKWLTGCGGCAQRTDYPKSFVDRSRRNHRRKKAQFTAIPNLELIVPSQWMRENVAQSYMQDYPVHLLPNGIDTALFHPVRGKEGDGRYTVLAVASEWGPMKGIDHINRLAEELDEQRYRLVTVGHLQKGMALHPRIHHIPHTNNIEELCSLYTAADVFVNPTLQETQGLTTVEAFACGTPAVIFRSGGAAECVDDTCGIAVPRDDFDALRQGVEHICEQKPFTADACRAKAETYNKDARYQAFLELYETGV